MKLYKFSVSLYAIHDQYFGLISLGNKACCECQANAIILQQAVQQNIKNYTIQHYNKFTILQQPTSSSTID